MGDASSSVTGEHAFIWGPWSVSSGEYAGLVAASAAFSTVGGPWDFRMEGLGDWAFYEQVGSIPYATLEVSPMAFTVPWCDEGELRGSVAYGPKDARVTYALSTEGFVRLAEGDAAFVVDREAFLTAGAQPTNAVVRLTQTYDRQAVTNEVAVLLSPATTSLTLSPGSITVSNADDGGSATAEGADEPCLTYALRPDAAGLVRVEGKTAFAGSEILRLRDAWLEQNLTTNATWQVEVPWEASYKGVVVTNDVAELTIEVALESKAREDTCDCECAEGTQAEAGCVSFRQAFGRTPRLAGMPQGALAIEATTSRTGSSRRRPCVTTTR